MGVAAQGHHQIVTTVFALSPDDAGDPPHRGMIKEKALDHSLQQVHQVVAAADVREFMEQNGLDLLRRHSGEHANRDQNHGTQIPHDTGRIGEGRFEQRNRRREPHAFTKLR